MAAVLELQRQLQDHGHQLAQLSQQLQNVEHLIRSQESLHTSFKTPRNSRSPPVSASPERKDGAPSCTTEMEIAQARWEALVNMIELEEQTRTRDVAELRKMIEESKKDKSEQKLDSRFNRFELQLADLRREFEGFVKQTKGRLAMQEETIKDLVSRSCKEFEDRKVVPVEGVSSMVSEMSPKPQDARAKMEALKVPVVNPVAVPVEGEGRGLSQTLAHAQSQDALSDSAKRRTASSSPISRNAYARLGACGKSQTINVVQDAKPPVLQRKTPIASPVAHVAPVASVAPVPFVREGTTGSLMEPKFERTMVEPPRIMTAARLSPPMTYRSVRTPVKPNMVTKDFNAFVMPSPPAPHVRYASPAPSLNFCWELRRTSEAFEAARRWVLVFSENLGIRSRPNASEIQSILPDLASQW
eukprot:s1719_g10.t1